LDFLKDYFVNIKAFHLFVIFMEMKLSFLIVEAYGDVTTAGEL